MITALTTTAVRGWVTGPGTDELLPTSLQKRSRPGEAVPAGLGWAGLGWAPRPRGLALRFFELEEGELESVSRENSGNPGKIKKDRILGWVRPPRKSYVITRKSVNSGLFSFFSLVSAKALGCVGCGPKKHTSRTPRQTDGFLWRGEEVGRDPKATNQGLWFILGRYGNTTPTGRESDLRGEGAPPAPATRGGTAPIAGNKNWNPTG